MSSSTKLLGKEDEGTMDSFLKPLGRCRRKLQKRRAWRKPRDIICLDEPTTHHAYSPDLPPTSTGRNTSNMLTSDDYQSLDIPDVPQGIVLNAGGLYVEKNTSATEAESHPHSGDYYDWVAQESLKPKMSNNSYYPMEVESKFKVRPVVDSEPTAVVHRHVLPSPQEAALDGHYSTAEKEVLLFKSQDRVHQIPNHRHPSSASSYLANLIDFYCDDSRHPSISHDDRISDYEESVYCDGVYDSVYDDSVYSESDHSLEVKQQLIPTNESDHGRSRDIDTEELLRDDHMEAEMYLGLLTSQIATGLGRNHLTDNTENLAKWRMGMMLDTLASIPREIEQMALGLPVESIRRKSGRRRKRSPYKVHEQGQDEEKGTNEWM